MKKFEFTGETKTLFDGTVLHRIKALVRINFKTTRIEVGDIGGWIEKEENLSHNGNAWVHGNAMVSGNAKVSGNANVSGNAWVYGNAEVYGNASVSGNAEVSGYAEVSGNARVFGNASVSGANQYLVIGPIGSRNAFTTFFRTKDGNIKVVCGCFVGAIDEFLAKVRQTHGDSKHAKVYQAAVEVALAQLKDIERGNDNA